MQKIDDFILFLFPLIQPIYTKHWDIVKETGKKLEDIGTDKENYLKEMYVFYQTVQESIEKLNNTNVYLTVENIPQHYKDKGIDDVEFYKYHIENFHIRCISIIDYITLMVNHSLQIGIPVRKCNTYSITENTNYKSSHLSSLLNSFESEFREMKTMRNKLIHQGLFKSQELSEIDSSVFSPMIEELMGERLTDYFKIERTKKIEDAVSKFKAQIERIEFNVGEILEELIPLIKKQIEIFKLSE